MTACFTGHRQQSFGLMTDKAFNKLRKNIKTQIIDMIENKNAVHFITGMALGVDTWCAEIVLELKSKYPYIFLECVLPCETQAKYWNEKQREKYYNIIEKCDKETLLQSIYTKGCMLKRNEYMVDSSDCVLAVWNGAKSGGTYYTVKYARKMKKEIVYIDC